MSTSTASARANQRTSVLAQGHIVGGRFEVERAIGDDTLGTILAARDQKTQRPIALRVLAPELITTPEAVEILRVEVRTAAGLSHRNVCATYGMGTEPNGARYIACEWMVGQPLANVVARRQSEGAPLSLRGAYNVLAHVARALDALHEKGSAHGAVRPTIVWISKAGRVRLAEVGIANAILRTAGPDALGPHEQHYLAPELKKKGGAPTTRTDVFGLGSLLYAMLTGRSAADAFVAPSSAHAEATAEVDRILLSCLAANPKDRFATPAEVCAALAPFCGGDASAEDAGLGVDIDVDIDMPISIAPPAFSSSAEGAAPRAPGRPAAPPRPAALPRDSSTTTPAQRESGPGSSGNRPAAPRGPSRPSPLPASPLDAPAIGARVSIHEEFRASLVHAPPVAAPRASVELGNILAKITENDAARWMIVKDNLDHGPFSGRELVGLIAKGEVLGDHGLMNMDTGERRKVKENPEFHEFVEQYRLKKSAEDEKAAIVTAAKVETASNTAKYLIAGSVLIAIGLLVGVFFYTRQGEQEHRVADANLADLYERGEITLEGTAGILPDPPRGSGRRSGGSHRSSGGGGGPAGQSYEDAMNQVVDIGSAAREHGGESRLSPQQVAGALNSRINTLFTCVSAELRSGHNLGRVRIDSAIAGNGSVIGSSVRAGSNEFQRCVQQRIASVRFPSFGAPRMGASYTIDASQ